MRLKRIVLPIFVTAYSLLSFSTHADELTRESQNGNLVGTALLLENSGIANAHDFMCTATEPCDNQKLDYHAIVRLTFKDPTTEAIIKNLKFKVLPKAHAVAARTMAVENSIPYRYLDEDAEIKFQRAYMGEPGRISDISVTDKNSLFWVDFKLDMPPNVMADLELEITITSPDGTPDFIKLPLQKKQHAQCLYDEATHERVHRKPILKKDLGSPTHSIEPEDLTLSDCQP